MMQNILKRTVSSFLAIALVVTTVFVFGPSGLFPAADAAITPAADVPDVRIVVPETLYLTPGLSASQSVQYYINNTVDGTVITPDEDRAPTEGKIWFNVSDGTVTDLRYTIVGTNKKNVAMSAGSGAAALTDVTLDTGLEAAGVRMLEWIFTCRIDGRDAEYHAFSAAYAPYYAPVGAAVNAKHGNAGLQSQGIAWISGVHGCTDSSPSPVSGDNDNWIAGDYRARTQWDGEWNRPLVPMIEPVTAPTNNDQNITDWLSQSETGACPEATFTLYDVDKSVGGFGSKSIDVATQSHIANITVDISRNGSFTTVPNVTTGFFVSDLKRDSKWMGSYGGYIANYAGSTPGIDFWFSLNHYYDGAGEFAVTDGVDTDFFGGNPSVDNGNRTFTTDAIPYNGLWNRATPTAAGTSMQYIHAATCCEYGNNWIYMNMYLMVNVTAVDKTELRNKVFQKQAQANAKTTDDYAAVREKLEAAYRALGDPTATQAAIDSALAGLDDIDASVAHTETVYAQHVNQLTGEPFPGSETEHLTIRRSDSGVTVAPNSFTGYTYTGMHRTYGMASAFGLFDANAWAQSDCAANGSGISAVDYDAASRTITVHNTDAESCTGYPLGNVLNSGYARMAVDPSETYTIDFDYASAANAKIGVICYNEAGGYIGSAWLSDSFASSGSTSVFRHHTETFCAQSSPYLFGLADRYDVRYIVLTFGISASDGQSASDAVFTNIAFTPSDALFDLAQWSSLTSSLRSSTNASGVDEKTYDSACKTLSLVSIRPESNTSYTSGSILTSCEVAGTRYYPWNYIPVDSGSTYTVEGEYAGTGNGQILISHYNINGDFTGTTRLAASAADGGILASTGSNTNFDPFYASFTVRADDAYIALSFGGYNNPFASAFSPVTNVFRGVELHDFSAADDVYTLFYRPNPYTVTFEPNGGVGTMEPQAFAYSVAQNLRANTFTRPGYSFDGWAATANGSKLFGDEDEVCDLTADANASVPLYACWTADAYTIRYDAADGEIVGDAITEYDADTLFTLPAAVKDGCTLTGWRADGSGNWGPIVYKTETPLTGLFGNVTLTAVWRFNTYSVAFNPNGGEGAAMANQNFVYGTPQALSANAYSRTGCTFLGWAPTDDAVVPLYGDKQEVQDLTVEANATVTLYAVWGENTYTIVYSTNGGEIRDAAYTTAFTISEQIHLPLTVEKEGYTFAGWKPAARVGSWNNETVYTGTVNSGMIGNVTLQAQWTAKGYTIVYAPAGGSIVGTKYTTAYDITTAITLPQARRTGYSFDGWQADGTGNWREDVYQAGSVSAGRFGDVTLTAQWTGVQYYVQFNGNNSTDGMMYNQSFTYGETGTLHLNEFVRVGYSFLGWALSGTAAVPTYADGGEVLNLSPTAGAIVTIYAVWEKDVYTITYDPACEEVSVPAPTTYTITDTVTLPAAVRKGYALLGWSPVQNSGSWHTWDTYSNSIAFGCYGDVTLRAKWEKESFVICYDPAQGTISGSYTTEYDVDTQIVLPSVTRTGYTFAGWQASAEWNNAVVTDAAPANAAGNVTLTALWVPNTYSVRFHANSGSGSMDDQAFTFDEANTLTPNAFERLGYTFSGWAATETGSLAYANGAEVINLTQANVGIVHLYAVWSARNFAIVYDFNGADAALAGTTVVMDGNAVTLRGYNTAETFIDGVPYNFGGWAYTQADADNGAAAYGNKASFSLNSEVLSLADVNWTPARPVITLHAVWTPLEVRLIVPDGMTTVIDSEKHYIYGLKANISREELQNTYLGVLGNGRLEISPGAVGTGTVVQLYSNSTNTVLETYEVVIFGDINGDGLINSSDVTNIRLMNAGLLEISWNDVHTFAADLNADQNVNSSDVTDVRLLNAGVLQYDQAARCLIDG